MDGVAVRPRLLPVAHGVLLLGSAYGEPNGATVRCCAHSRTGSRFGGTRSIPVFGNQRRARGAEPPGYAF